MCEDYTNFGYVPNNGENFSVDISKLTLFFDDESKTKERSQFNDHLIKLIFQTTRKPCCWSFGRLFKQSGDVKLHAVCLNSKCEACLIVYTENLLSILQITIFNYDSSIQHSNKRYLTGSDEEHKVESILALESAMVTRAKLASEYLFEENDYATHLCSAESLKQRKHRMLSKSFRH